MAAAKTKSIAVGGFLAALTLISLFLATVVPTGRLSLYALSSFPTAVIVIEYGIRRGWAFYASTALLGLIIIPDKTAVIPFIVFFGIYGAVKYHIEKIRKLFIEYPLKLLYFNLCLAAALITLREFFFAGSQLDKFPLGLLIIAFEVVFILYDYVYTLFIDYYHNRLKSILKI